MIRHIYTYVKYIVSLFIIFVFTCFFYPKKVYVHYHNANHPIQVVIYNYDNSAEEKRIYDGTASFTLKRPMFKFTDQVASLTWGYKGKRNSLGITSEAGNPDFLKICKLDIFLNPIGDLVKYKVTPYLFLNFCL